ncbi:MAG: methylmalonyl-CoA epimerase [Deltaproteobacteria bacterium]|nr:methylmalonyl-CoA epimerase [Deltaproteobacteria bacterium]
MHPIDHIGIAVNDLEASIKMYQETFGYEVDEREILEKSGVELVFLKAPNTLLELLRPLNDQSPIAKFLAKRGQGIHHICFRVPDIEAELKKLADQGVELIDKTPRPGAYNSKIAFIHPSSTDGTLIELCQREV